VFNRALQVRDLLANGIGTLDFKWPWSFHSSFTAPPRRGTSQLGSAEVVDNQLDDSIRGSRRVSARAHKKSAVGKGGGEPFPGSTAEVRRIP
jgi:hypothetical protein